jgi:hypothetical protein
VVFWRLAVATANNDLSVGQAITYLISALTVSSIAFGGLNWSLDAASAPAATVERLSKTFAN